jgi:hypothetical protein
MRLRKWTEGLELRKRIRQRPDTFLKLRNVLVADI